KSPEWPVLETRKSFEILACGENLDEAAKIATENAVKALMREHGWSFEKAYMFGSLVVDLKINQVVDPKKGVRAAIPRDYISLKSLIP
ncbi:MAG: acetamidase/formamidase family protein, partial [Candidatus Bathycorpusculaceae bacterium]